MWETIFFAGKWPIFGLYKYRIGLLLVITSPVISWAGEGFGEWNEEALKYAQDRVRCNPNGADAHTKLGFNLN
ncbi:uncharacterized protein METZ01_LOCUS419855 [marine metagenome]|uniref:Uncharacterized protein n=1 Tax=marine metagenome TaxID=408172 RepID=A0A382X9K7_9ZZZZ